MNRLATRTDAVNAVSKVNTRDPLGNIITANDRKGQAVTINYDPLQSPSSGTFAGGSTLAWTWDLAGRLTKLQDSTGGTFSRTYDGLDHIVTETTAQGTASTRIRSKIHLQHSSIASHRVGRAFQHNAICLRNRQRPDLHH